MNCYEILIIIFVFILVVILGCVMIKLVGCEDMIGVSGGGDVDIDIVMDTEQTPEKIQKQFRQLFGAAVGNSSAAVKLTDLKKDIDYSRKTEILQANLHDGQRKLFLSEIQFLTNVMPSREKQQVIVYAGAAPSMKAHFALQYFPNTVWVFVDPNPFKIMTEAKNFSAFNKSDDIKFIKSNELDTKLIDELSDYNSNKSDTLEGKVKIFIINELFTEDIATKLSKIKNLLFICDIRTSLLGDDGPSDVDILWNLSQQWLWMKIMKPSFSWLKFRHPFYLDVSKNLSDTINNRSDLKKHFETIKKETKVDFIANHKTKNLFYVPGEIYLQAYAPYVSTETRLLVKQKDLDKSVSYGPVDKYESKFVYFNKLKRSYIIHKNKYADKSIGYDQCQDCALCTHIWESYIKKYKIPSSEMTPLTEVKKYQDYFNRSLIKNMHGLLYDKLTNEHLNNIVKHDEEMKRRNIGKYKK